MYTVQYLFRKNPTSPNRVFSITYICISLFFTFITGINYTLSFSLAEGMGAGALALALSATYWLGMKIWGIHRIFSNVLSREGLSFVSIYSIESAAKSENIFVDTVTHDPDFNENVIFLSPLPMDNIESMCEANHVGEYFCNISENQAGYYIKRRVAMGKVVTVALDHYSSDVALDEADCVLLPTGKDCLGSPACAYYDPSLYSSSAEACRVYISLATDLMGLLDNFYGKLALRCLLFQFIFSVTDFININFGITCGLFAGLLITLLLISLHSLKVLEREVCSK